MSNNPDKPAKPQRNPPPNPFAAGGNPAASSSLPVADSTHGGKSAAPPAKPSFLLGKEPSAKPSNPFFAGSDTNKAESAIAGNPVNVGETFGNDTSRVVTNPSANTFGAEPVFSAPPIPHLATPVTVATSLPAPPLPPVPPPETPKISSESHESFGPTIPPPIPIAAVESFASEVSTPHNLPPPPPAVPIVIEPPNLPPVPPTFDLSPPPTSNKSLFPEPILGAPPTSFGDDDPFAIDVKPHSLSAPSAKVVENPFAPKAPAKSNVSDPFSSPAPSGGFDSFGSSSKVSSDPFAASSDPFSTTQKPLSTPVDFGASDPFATPVTATAFAASSDPFATSAPVAPSSTSKVSNPFAPPPLPSSAAPPVRPPRRPSADPFTAATALDPFATPTSAVHPPIPATIPTTSPSSFVADPFASTATTDPFLTPTVAVHPPIPASVPAVAPHFDSSFPAPPVPAIPVQEDDDPYLIITNKPPPVVPVAPTQPPKPVIKAKEDAPKKPKEGDPFDIPLPGLEKPKTSEPAKPVDPTASIPLKELIKIKQAPAPAPAVPTQTAPNAPVNPFSPNASNKPPATSTAPVVAPIPFTSTPVTVNSVTPQHPVAADPFSTTNDPFGPSSTPLFPAPAKPVVHDDPFASSSSTFNDDPFGNAFSAPSVPTTKSSAHPVVDDFDIFNKPTPHPAPANAKATPLNVPPPMPAKPHKAAPSQPATATLPKTTPAVPASGNLLEGDWIDASSTANKPKQTVHDGTFDDMDPFTVQAVDDPFASQPSDDPFASEGATDSHEDMLEKFRLMYGVKGQADDDGHDIYDSDFDDDFDHPKGKSSASSTAKSSSKPAGDGSVPQGLAYGEMLARGTNPEVIDGEILSRLSTKSLVVKDWHDTYYIIIKGFLFLYKTKLDYQYNPKGTNYKKKLPITYNLSVSPLKAKEYKGYGTVYNFMLEEVMDYGRTNIGKFGSTLKPVAENLWKQLRAVILYKRHIRTHPPAQYK